MIEGRDTIERDGRVEAARPSLPAGRLVSLSVRDLALIEAVDLELEPGFNVLTGETGAGKSLLIDALGLALGARADTTLVRHRAAAARVEARFDRAAEPLVVAREVSSAGRSTARVDDETTTAGRLADVVSPLVDVHGQHDQQRLLDEAWQRDLLDAFGGLEDARGAVAAAFGAWQANRARLAELAIDPRELERRLGMLEHEANEIAAARLRPGEADEIRSRLEVARHAEAIRSGGQEIATGLAGDGDGDSSARDAAARALAAARAVERVDARFAPIAERLAGTIAEIEDLAETARTLIEALDHDPAALLELEERLSLIYSLERRYGDDEAAVIAYGERAADEVRELRGVDDERERRTAEDGRLLEDVARAAAALSARRRSTADELGESVPLALESLGFRPHAFSVGLGRRIAGPDEPAVEIDGDALAFDASGIDDVVYRFAPNEGEPARPLARIASGGELSRVALAIREVLAEVDDTPTLVFDEIDTGIGGRSAEPVGRSLWALARRHQVLCVTHLPQIAAYADAHFQISKVERRGRTATIVRRLDPAGRVRELAAMIGGVDDAAEPPPASVASARELLDRAVGWRGDRASAAG